MSTGHESNGYVREIWSSDWLPGKASQDEALAVFAAYLKMNGGIE